MKVICSYYPKCKEIEEFNEHICSHSHSHDRKGGCEEDNCGLLDRNSIYIKVSCKPVVIYERKEKLEKLYEKVS